MRRREDKWSPAKTDRRRLDITVAATAEPSGCENPGEVVRLRRNRLMVAVVSEKGPEESLSQNCFHVSRLRRFSSALNRSHQQRYTRHRAALPTPSEARRQARRASSRASTRDCRELVQNQVLPGGRGCLRPTDSSRQRWMVSVSLLARESTSGIDPSVGRVA